MGIKQFTEITERIGRRFRNGTRNLAEFMCPLHKLIKKEL